MDDQTMHGSNGYLLSQACKLYRALAAQRLETIGMYKGQELILCELWQTDGATQSELAERLLIQPSTLTNALHSMEKSGLVCRRPDEVDQRVSRVYLTEQANEKGPEINRVWDEIEEVAFGNLTLEERIVLRRLLMQVADNLSQRR